MKKSGIYKITNLVNNKIYLGSSVDVNKRKNAHFSELKRGVHHSIILQNAYNEYGMDNFKFVKIIDCNVNDLVKLEQCFINILNPEYNVLTIAGSSLGHKCSDETKQKLRDINLGKKHTKESKLKMSKIHKGKIVSESTKEKMRYAMMGNKNFLGKDVELTKEKRMMKIRKPVVQLTENYEFIKEFVSITIASKELGVSGGNVSRCCQYEAGINKINKTINGFKFMYKSQYCESCKEDPERISE